MKTLDALKVVFLASVLIVSSCKKDKDEAQPSDYPFAQETVSQGKANLEDAGQSLITEMKAMQNVEAGDALEAFADFSSTSSPFGTSLKSAPVFRTMGTASTIVSGNNDFSALMKSIKADITEDTTFTQIYNKYKATYTWNLTTKTWVKTASADFKFIFPSKKDGSTNDATLTITYTGKTGLSLFNNYSGDLPETFNASIVVASKKVFEINFSASYNSDSYPTSVSYFIALYPFKYEISWSYSTSNITVRYQLTNGSKNIFDCYGSTNGNFSKQNMDNSESYDVINDANAYYQVFNIKLAGYVNYKGLFEAEQKAYENGEGIEVDKAYINDMNNYIKLDLVYADSKQKIASAEIYPAPYTEEYYDWSNQEYVTEEGVEPEVRFIFADNSKGDMESYFKTGFSALVNDLNSFIIELNNDYDLTMGQVDY